METELEIYRKYVSLIAYTEAILRKFPKSESFALVQEIRTSLYTSFRYLMFAIKLHEKNEKIRNLNELDVELKLLKIHLRLSFCHRHISEKTYNEWSKKYTAITDMLREWVKVFTQG